jgi:hypothetical protein
MVLVTWVHFLQRSLGYNSYQSVCGSYFVVRFPKNTKKLPLRGNYEHVKGKLRISPDVSSLTKQQKTVNL